MNECKKHLESLGPCRETKDQQHEFLLNLATRFQNTTLLALAARYGADDIFDRIPALKLATAVVNRNTTFADDVSKTGHTVAFSQAFEVSEDNDDQTTLDSEDDDCEVSDEQSYTVRYTDTAPELIGILHEESEVPMPKAEDILQWLDGVYKSTRGFELGTSDASLLPNIWKKQSVNWRNLALSYVSDIVSLVHQFILALISAICEDQRVQSALKSILMDGLVDRYKKSIDHADFILTVERAGTLLTLNRYFTDNHEKW